MQRQCHSGDLDPSLKAFDDATGEILWQTKLDDLPTSGIITYSVNDTQYVAIMVGMGNLHVQGIAGQYAQFNAKLDTPREIAPKGGAAIWAFALDQTEE